MTVEFARKIAVVTGGGSGLGRALCLALAQEAAVVVVTDIDGASAAQTAASIREEGGQAQHEALDVSDASAFTALVDRIVQRHGRIDLLFNNAGFAVAGDLRDIAHKDWRRIVDVNIMGVVNGTLAAYAHMVRQGSGHIVNTASVAGLVEAPTLTPYAMTKAAVVSLSMNLRTEAAMHGVKVSAICPGFIQTRIYDAATVARVSNTEVFSLIPFKLMPADAAAQAALRGVKRNQARIVYPFHAKLMWTLYRISPALLAPVLRKAVRYFQRLRDRAGA